MKRNYTILAIETSLDDTCAAVTCDDRVLSNVVASQVKFHEEYGGTVPHIAKRKHVEWIDQTIEEALTQAKVEKSDVDAIAVTYGPGLAPCLEVGIAKAKTLAREWEKPLIAVNHMEGHLLSSLAKNSKGKGSFFAKATEGLEPDKIYPALGFLISGGHTELVLMKAMGKYRLLGETLDDAAGEAYDKVARMLNLGYPGGPILSELAKSGNPKAYPLPEPMRQRNDLNFSFSGLKTAALYTLRRLQQTSEDDENVSLRGFSKQFVTDFAASFQRAAMKMLMRRFERAIRLHHPKMVLLGGGVVSNVAIRSETRSVAKKYGLPVHIPYSAKLFTDNAAMIGVAAWYKAKRREFWKEIETLDRVPNLDF